MKFKGLTRVTNDLCAVFQAYDRIKPSLFNRSSIKTQLLCDYDESTRHEFKLAYNWILASPDPESISTYPSITTLTELQATHIESAPL